MSLSYSTLSEAISALNAATITAPVIITLQGNETAPSGGYVITAQGTMANPITINGNQKALFGSSANVAGSFTDAVLKLVGADYVIIQNFIIMENPAALNETPSTNTVTEWGIALLGASTSNGAQNNLIQNNAISLRTSSLDRNTFGIYSSNNHPFNSITSWGYVLNFNGTNSYNKIYNNAISKTSLGIAFVGNTNPLYPDQNNEIGGLTTGLGNEIFEWGHSSTSAAYPEATSLKCAIRSVSQINEVIANNNILSNYMGSNVNGVSLQGISKINNYSNPMGTTQIVNNTVTLEALDHFLSGIECSGIAQLNTTININNNKLIKWKLNTTNTAVGITGIINFIPAASLNITNNLIRGFNTQQTSGTFTGIENQAIVTGTVNITGNKFGNDESPLVTFSGITGIANLISNTNGGTSCTLNISSNEFNRIIYTVSSNHSLRFINISSSSANVRFRYFNMNIFKNMTLNMTGQVVFFNFSSNLPANSIVQVNDNSIVGNFVKSGASGDIKILDTGSGFSAGTNTTFNINNNIFSGITSTGSSVFNGIYYNLGENFTCTGNSFVNLNLGGTNTMGNYCVVVSAATIVNISNNMLDTITTPFAFSGLENSQTGTSATLSNNIISNINAGTSLSGLSYLGNHALVTVKQNQIFNLVAANGNVTGINFTANSGSTVSDVSQNKIYGLTANASSNLVKGLIIGLSSSNNLQSTVSNNLIGQLSCPVSGTDNSVRCVDLVSTSSSYKVNFYHNTFYLNAISSGTNFGSSIITSNNLVILDLRNNIFINNSTPNGTGLAVIFKNISVTQANYKSSSGNNLLYAGIPDSKHLMYSSGADADITLQDFKVRVYPRETGSVTENPVFISLAGWSAGFLHLDPSIATLAGNGGLSIEGITVDYDGEVRAGSPGYPGMGDYPDIGADEGDFGMVDATGPNIIYTKLSHSASLTSRVLNNVLISDVSNVNTASGLKPRVYYKKKVNANTFADNTSLTDGWKFVEATGSSSPFDFTLDYGLLFGGNAAIGDTIQYFVIAQDMNVLPNVAVNSGILSTIPSSVSLDATNFPVTNAINNYAIKLGIEGTKTVCNTGCDFTSLTNSGGIFETINSSLVTDHLIIHISGDLLAETGTVPLNEFNAEKTILIRPSGGAHRTISGTASNGKPLIDLNGADHLTIDGINMGGDSLTISNLSTSSFEQTATVRFTNGAESNTLIRCTILGSSTVSLGSTGGVILFNNAVSGNNNNTISTCNIGPAGSNFPVALIVSNSTQNLTGNTVSNCNLFDYFSSSKSSAALYFENASNTAWNILGNRFFQTTAKVFASGSYYHYCMSLIGGTNHSIQNNVIGFSAPNETGVYTITGGNNASFVPVNLNLGISDTSFFQGNKIKNILFSGTSPAEFTLIYAAGKIHIGTILPNIIGDTLLNSSIVYTRSTSSNGSCNGIAVNQAGTNAIVKNNIMGGISVNNAGTGGCTFQAILVYGSAIADISDNIIGGSVPSSFQCVSNNISTSTGINYGSGTVCTISGNTIRNLTASGTTTTNIYGIYVSSVLSGSAIERNKIFEITSAGSAGGGLVGGIYLGISSSISMFVGANLIHTLISEASARTVAGINIDNGTSKIINNIIRLGLKADGTSMMTPCAVFGILENAGVNKIYHNTVLIAGSEVSDGTQFSTAFRRLLGTSDEIRNNIFSNQRFNLSTGGSHYNIYFDALALNTSVINKNLYYNSGGNGNVFGRRSTTTFLDIGSWSTTLQRDLESVSENPVFISSLANSQNFDLHILMDGNSAADKLGDPLADVPFDFDGQQRNTQTPDAGADEGDFNALLISYAPLSNSKITTSIPLNNVTINAQQGVNNTSGFKPRVYYKKKSDANDLTGWKFIETTTTSSPYNFNLDFSLLNTPLVSVGYTIQYFVAAQDLSMPSRVSIEGGLLNVPASDINLGAAQFPIAGNIRNFAILDTLFGNYTVCNSGCDFNSLTNNGGFFENVNNSLVSGDLVVSINGDLLAETGTHSLNPITAPYSVTILPAGGVVRNISGSVSGKGLITLFGADNIIIDGLNTGGNGLTISNTSTSTTTYTSTIEIKNDANNNLIKNAVVLGSSPSTNCGNIIVTLADKNSGNDNNRISKCMIGPAGANLPLNGIWVAGFSINNNSTVIDSNIIFDYFGPAINSNGIYVGNFTANTLIRDNKFYQSSVRTQTSSIIHSAISIAGGYATISGNVIGGSDPTNMGTYNVSSTNSFARFYPIYLTSSVSGDSTKIIDNIIKNIAVSGNRSGTGSSSPFSAICISNGLAVANGNTIGSMEEMGSISYTSSSGSTGDVAGIINVSSSYTLTADNNIGGITLNNSSTGACHFYGIRIENTALNNSWDCLRNTIGGNHPQSIQSLGVNTSTQLIGIYSATCYKANVKNNIVKNLTRPVVTATYGQLSGIRLFRTSGTSTYIVSDNEIYNLANTAPANASIISGIMISHGSTGSVANIERNRVHSLTTSNPLCEVVGIYTTAGTFNLINNIVRLGINPDGSHISSTSLITAFYESFTTTGNYLNNSVFVGGNVTGTGNSRIYFTNKSVAGGVFRNNIFENSRSNSVAGGSHTVFTSSQNISFNSNNNLYYTPGTDGKMALIGAISRVTLDAWRVANLTDAGSLFGSPNFINALGDTATFSLNINPAMVSLAESTGIAYGNVNVDVEGQLRSGLTPHDMGAYAGNFISGDFFGPTINFADLTNNLVAPDNLLSNVVITDVNGVENTPGLKPRLYFKKLTDPNTLSGWKFVEASNAASPYSFTMDYSLLNSGFVSVGDIIQYFVVASDTAVVPNVGKREALFTVSPTDVNLTASQFPVQGNLKSYSIKGSVAGTQTVCPGGCDFNSLTNSGGAFDVINNSIVTADVLLKITADLPNETGLIALNEFASPFQLTIKPDGGQRVITNTSINDLITLNGADNVTIDGSLSNDDYSICPVFKPTRDLTLKTVFVNSNNAIVTIKNTTTGGASNNVIKNCLIEGNNTSTTNLGISSVCYGELGISANNDNKFLNNQITKVKFGIYSRGQSLVTKNNNTEIVLNDISLASANNSAIAGIYLGFEDNASIVANNVANISGPFVVAGIALGKLPRGHAFSFLGEEVTGVEISQNKINDITAQDDGSAFGICLASVISSGVNENLCKNNFIYNIGSTAGTSTEMVAGLLVGGGVSGSTKLLHNTIRLTGSSGVSLPSFCLAIGGMNPQVTVKNNILVNEMPPSQGKQYAIGFGYENTFSGLQSNRNNFFTTGTAIALKGGLGNSPAGNIAGFTAYKTVTGGDANSKNIQPDFVSTSDLHLSPSTVNFSNLDGKGENVGILVDFDCDTRAAGFPDIGGDEIVGCNNPEIMLVSADVNPLSCSGNTCNLTVTGNLNDATEWKWYATSCGSTPIGSGSTIAVNPAASTFYFVRGEGGCTEVTDCSSINIQIATPTITNTNDTGTGSLRHAIGCAEEGDTLIFNPSVLNPSDTIKITSSTLNINKSLFIEQANSSILKIKAECPQSLFTILSGKTLGMKYIDIYLSSNHADVTGRAIFNQGLVKMGSINIFDKTSNFGGSGNTIINEPGSAVIIESAVNVIKQ